MLDAEHFASLDISTLADQCDTQTKNYFRRLEYEARYCFELMCRAFQNQYDVALRHIYAIYVPLLAARARRHPLFWRSCQDANLFAHTALSNFYHAVKGEAFVQKFGTLAQAVAYMHTCVHTAILEDARDQPPTEPSQYEMIPAPSTESELSELWVYISNLLSDDQDRRIAYLRFVLEMKPAEIAEQYAQYWATPRDVSVALQRVRRALRASDYLREMAGLIDETSRQQPDEM